MKGDLGWDEFHTRKFRTWEHLLAMTILAAWFMAETRDDWMQRFAQDLALLAKYEVDLLPQLSPQVAAQLVTTYLVT